MAAFQRSVTALGQALKWGLVQRNAAALVDGPKVRKPDIKPFNLDEVSKLVVQFENDRFGPLYLVALSLGLRRGAQMDAVLTAAGAVS